MTYDAAVTNWPTLVPPFCLARGQGIGDIASAEREPITGSGAEPPTGFRGQSPGQGSGDEAP